MARKEVNTALASNKNIPVVEAKAPTKNIAGPPVYYPPGQELFSKSEAQAAWRAKVCISKFYDYLIYIVLNNMTLYISFVRVAMEKVAVNMSMKQKVNLKVPANQVLLSFQSVCHYVVPCLVRLCKKAIN